MLELEMQVKIVPNAESAVGSILKGGLNFFTTKKAKRRSPSTR